MLGTKVILLIADNSSITWDRGARGAKREGLSSDSRV